MTKRAKRRTVKAYSVKGFVVDGSWGVTAAFTYKERAIEEMLRIERTGYSANVLPCLILYELPVKRQRKV